MAYTNVTSKGLGDTWTHSDHNTYWRDNMAAQPPDAFTAKGDLYAGTAADAGARLGVGANGKVPVADSSETTGIKWAHLSGAACSARYTLNSTAQTIGNNSTTLVQFNSQSYDTDSAVTTGAGWKFTVPAGHDGDYVIAGLITLTATAGWAANERAIVRLYKNGASASRIIGARVAEATHSLAVSVPFLGAITLAATDYIDVRLDQNNGGNVSVTASATLNHIAIARMCS